MTYTVYECDSQGKDRVGLLKRFHGDDSWETFKRAAEYARKEEEKEVWTEIVKE